MFQKAFIARIEPVPDKGGAYIRVPIDIKKVWKSQGESTNIL